MNFHQRCLSCFRQVRLKLQNVFHLLEPFQLHSLWMKIDEHYSSRKRDGGGEICDNYARSFAAERSLWSSLGDEVAAGAGSMGPRDIENTTEESFSREHVCLRPNLCRVRWSQSHCWPMTLNSKTFLSLIAMV